ncbi:hypothetical protein [Aureibacter tunicatorum]|uniref:Uncharacterized protein n=1 Tax=Aureibacter tunicatorum TaxID=866807 RepID=A0AAE3XN47_9BACT|nr:hypothetical protein [Aureibacter tunicatorum]MDR6240981.1 hypothetical protein [Aureibacter tunicatorum]BDD03760.1 hypothetical protein AUTU_12430 [Aureibacter tunicatorum]
MEEIINNPWVTGIGGGIISSLIVFFATRYFFGKREKKEYTQKIETANNEILYSIRPLVIDKKIPSLNILSSVILATAKKYGVKKEDLYNEYSLSNDLINEIMANSFLSSDQKIEFCELLQGMTDTLKENKDIEIIYLNKKNHYTTKYSSIVLSLMTFAMVLMSILLTNKLTDSDSIKFLKDILFITSSISITPILLMKLLDLIKRKKTDQEEKQNKGVTQIDNKEEKHVA